MNAISEVAKEMLEFDALGLGPESIHARLQSWANRLQSEAWQWLPMADAPKDEEILVCYCGEKTSYAAQWRDGKENYWELEGFYFSYDDPLTSKPITPDAWRRFPAAIPTQPRKRDE